MHKSKKDNLPVSKIDNLPKSKDIQKFMQFMNIEDLIPEQHISIFLNFRQFQAINITMNRYASKVQLHQSE